MPLGRPLPPSSSLQASLLLMKADTGFNHLVTVVADTKRFYCNLRYGRRQFIKFDDITITSAVVQRVLEEGKEKRDEGLAYIMRKHPFDCVGRRAAVGELNDGLEKVVRTMLRLISRGVDPYAHKVVSRKEYRRCGYTMYLESKYPGVQVVTRAEVQCVGLRIPREALYLCNCGLFTYEEDIGVWR